MNNAAVLTPKVLLFYKQGGGWIEHVLSKVNPLQKYYYLQTRVFYKNV